MLAPGDVTTRRPSGAGFVVVVTVIGFAAGALLALAFNVLHSNWGSIPGVTPNATSTVPFWTVQFLGPVLISVCWTCLALHGRGVGHWRLVGAGVLGVQVAILALALVPFAIAGNGGDAIGGLAQLVLIPVALGSPILGLVWPGGRKASGAGWHVAAAGGFAVALWAAQSLFGPLTRLI